MPHIHLQSHPEEVASLQKMYESRPHDLIEAVVAERRQALRNKFRHDIPPEYLEATLESFGYFGDQIREMALAMFTEKGNKNLLFEGMAGSGKTYAAFALCNLIQETDPKKVVFFERYPIFVQNLREEFVSGEYNEWDSTWEMANNYAKKWNGLIVLDDVGANKLTEFETEKLFMVLDQRVSAHYPTVITTNVPQEKRLEILGPRVASRLERFETVRFPNFDFRTLK